MQYTKKYRLIMAAGYLKTTAWPISEIGRKCGFQEMGYFAAQFRKTFAMTPTAYRKNG
jgi:AraC-like DNA-binding protein